MAELKLGLVEARFADIVWGNAPMTTKELVQICEKELNWKRTTTYTVLKKLCERGILHMENSLVTVLIPKDEFYAIQSEQFVQKNFQGSLPAFVAAFTTRQKPTQEDLDQIKKMIQTYEEANL